MVFHPLPKKHMENWLPRTGSVNHVYGRHGPTVARLWQALRILIGSRDDFFHVFLDELHELGLNIEGENSCIPQSW